VTTINVTLNGRQVAAELHTDSGCLRLAVEGNELEVNRTEVRAAMTEQATYYGDQGMWWDGYNSALADCERAVGSGKNVAIWVDDVRRKFDLPVQTKG
jgi:hypothetical protein